MSDTPPLTAAPTARTLVAWAEAVLERAELAYGHGTSSAAEEAVFLVFHALGLDFDCPEAALDAPAAAADAAAAKALVQARIASRRPAAYLTGRMWFAGLELAADERALVPRSPIAELVETGFSPWLDAVAAPRILEVGTGGGCIAVAAAAALPASRVDATDCSPAALALARQNCRRHGVAGRVRLLEADLWPADEGAVYDLIVSNPPYVPAAELAALPAEYHHEPAAGLDGGSDGLAFARRLIAAARRRLAPGGVLIVEVGAQAAALERAYPRLPFLWLELERGGEGVFLLEREALP